MKPESRIDLGAIKIHKSVVADICCAAVAGVEGVTVFRNDVLEGFLALFGVRHNSAVDVVLDPRGQVSVVVKVNVRFGLNLSEISRRLQDAVMTAVEQMVDVDLKDVDVVVRGIERG
jgi:uncharacterized alkaline shock family protein YloU